MSIELTQVVAMTNGKPKKRKNHPLPPRDLIWKTEPKMEGRCFMSDRKYDRHGNEYRTTTVADGHALVWSQLENHDGGGYDGSLRTIPKAELHDAPPHGKVDDEIAAKRVVLEKVNADIRERRKELDTVSKSTKELMKRLKSYAALKHLDELLSGGITHYVKYKYGWRPPTIIVFSEAVSSEYPRHEKLKLLTLFGQSNGDLAFRLSIYSDGSGADHKVVPCVSRDEAIELTTAIFEAHKKEALDPEHKTRPSNEWRTRAIEYGISMGDDYSLAIDVAANRRSRDQIANLEAKIVELQGI